MADAKGSIVLKAPTHKFHKTENIQTGDLIFEEDLWLWSFLCRYSAKRACNFCFAPADSVKNYTGEPPSLILKQCGSCKSAFYCTAKCQQEDWKRRHKYECEMLKHCMERPEKYTLWQAEGVDPSTSGGLGITYSSILLPLVSKVLHATQQQLQRDPGLGKSSTVLDAYRKIPAKQKLGPAELSCSPCKGSFWTNQMTSFDAKGDGLAKRIVPALVTLNFSRQNCAANTQKVTTLGVCLEMARFGPHCCDANAVVMAGDGRNVRVIATAPIASLADVRLQRDTSLGLVDLEREERQNHLYGLFGYMCDCSRCVRGDANDPVELYRLRCPKTSCSGICIGLQFDDIPDGFCRIPTYMRSAAESAAAKAKCTAMLNKRLMPCSSCGSKYTVNDDIADELFEIGVNRLVEHVTDEILAVTLPRLIQLAKRYLHPSCRRYKLFLDWQVLAIMGRSGNCTNIKEVDAVMKDNGKIAEDVYVHIRSRLDELNDAAVNGGNNMPAIGILGLFANGMPAYTRFCQMQIREGERKHIVILARLIPLSIRFGEAAKKILERLVTPKQLESWMAF